MKLCICGSRNFDDYELLEKEINKIINQYDITEIVSGGANGADNLGEIYALNHNYKLTRFKANWALGKRAGFVRNSTLVEYADLVVAFWDEESKGTKDTIKKARKINKLIKIVLYKKITNIMEN